MKEQEFLAKEQAREKAARAAACAKEHQRIQRAEQARLETERILEEQQKIVEARKREMSVRDALREAKKSEKQSIKVPASLVSASAECACHLILDTDVWYMSSKLIGHAAGQGSRCVSNHG